MTISVKPASPALQAGNTYATNLAAFWVLEDNTADPVLDYSGNDYHLSAVGTPSWDSDANIGDYVIGEPSGPSGYEDTSCNFANPAQASAMVWFKWTGASNPASIVVFAGRATSAEFSVQTDGTARIHLRDDNYSNHYLYGTTDICDGDWHLIGVTYDYSGAAQAELFIDGVSEDTDGVGNTWQISTAWGLGKEYGDNQGDADACVGASAVWTGRLLDASDFAALYADPWQTVEAAAPSGPSISITTNPNTSDTAPALFHMDASATTDATVSDPARDLDFFWVVTDDGTSEVIDTGFGCCFATVIDEPGSYTATLYVNNAEEGTDDSDTVSLTVADPDMVYSGTDTICLSIAGDFTGAPSGASEITITDGDDINTYLAANKRVLLQRGETYAAADTVTIAANEYLGAFGTGTGADARGIYSNAPKLVSTWSGNAITLNGDDSKVAHLRVERATPTSGSVGIGMGGGGDSSNIVVHKCDVEGFEDQLTVSPALSDYYGNDPADSIAFSNCKLTPASSGTDYCAYIGATRLCIIGCLMESGADGEHTLRIPYSHKLVLRKGTFETNLVTSKHTLKIHHTDHGRGGTGAWVDVGTDLCITDNVWEGADMDWALTIAPQNASSDDRFDGVYFAYNRITVDNVQIALLVAAKGLKCDNNLIVGTSWKGSNPIGVFVGRRGVEPDPERARFFHNTMWGPESGVTNMNLVSIAASYTGTQALVKNNVVSGPEEDGTARVYDPAEAARITASNNLVSSDSPTFVDAPNGNFRLPSGADQIDAGTAVPVYRDFAGTVRDASPDIGAYEYSADYVPATTYTDPDPGPGLQEYRVRAVISAETGDWSDTASVTFSDGGASNPSGNGTWAFWW